MAGVVGVNHNVRQRHGSAVKRIAAGAGKLAVCLIAVAFVYRRDVVDILYEIAFAIVNVFAKLGVGIAFDCCLGHRNASITIIPYTCESVKGIVVIAFDITVGGVSKTAPELGAVCVRFVSLGGNGCCYTKISLFEKLENKCSHDKKDLVE